MRRCIAILFTALVAACGDDPAGPSTATLEVEAATAAQDTADFDQTGYRIRVDGGSLRNLPANGRVTFGDLEPGEHTVSIDGLDANCTLTGPGQRTVTLVGGRTERIVFAVSCAPRRGAVEVAITTSGVEIDPDGYTVELEDRTLAAGVNETVVFDDVPGGQREVRLDDVAENCLVSGYAVRGVFVAHGVIARVSFSVDCRAWAELRITARTSGTDPDANGYRAMIARDGATRETLIASDGSGTFADLAPALYDLFLLDVAVNCVVGGSNPREVDATAGGPLEVIVDVVCATPRELAFVNSAHGDADIYLVRSDGSGLRRLTEDAAEDLGPAWSPGGSRLAFSSNRDGDFDVYVMNADGTGLVRLTDHEAADYAPAWSPDGEKLAFISERDGNAEIYVMNADGSGTTRLTSDPAPDLDPAWSPDGGRIAFASGPQIPGGVGRSSGPPKIWLMDADGGNATQLTADDYYYYSDDRYPAWSADGERITFARAACDYYDPSNCGAHDIHVVNADGSELTALKSGAGDDTQPSWHPEGDRVAYTATECWTGYPGEVCESVIRVLRLGVEVIDVIGDRASNPAWRP